MMRAVWKGVVLSESLRRQYFTESSTTRTVGPWKGLARYCTGIVDGGEPGRCLVLPETQSTRPGDQPARGIL